MRATSGDGPLLEAEATPTGRASAAGWGSSTPATLSGSNVISGLWPGAHRSASASVNVSGPATATTPRRRGLLGRDTPGASWRRRRTGLMAEAASIPDDTANAAVTPRSQQCSARNHWPAARRRPVLRLEIGSAVARSVGLTELRTSAVVLRGQYRRVCKTFHAADGSVLAGAERGRGSGNWSWLAAIDLRPQRRMSRGERLERAQAKGSRCKIQRLCSRRVPSRTSSGRCWLRRSTVSSMPVAVAGWRANTPRL